MKLIDKSALVAEIEKRIEEYKSMKIDSSYYDGMIASLEFLRDEFIDTLEVKEVDFEKELDKYYGVYRDENGETHDIEDGDVCADWKTFVWSESDMRLAKYFFGLGMQVSSKTQKGE